VAGFVDCEGGRRMALGKRSIDTLIAPMTNAVGVVQGVDEGLKKNVQGGLVKVASL